MKRFIKVVTLFSALMFSSMAWVMAVDAAKWTFIIYLDADNNLEEAGLDDFMEMAQVGSNNDINIIVQMDRIDGYGDAYGNWTDCKRFRVTKNMQPTASNALQDLGEVNMGDPEVLKNFINWSTSNYTADRYVLILWDHGGGWQKKRNKLSSSIYKDICWDDTNGGDFLSMNEFKGVLDGLNKKINMIGFDACLMSMIENAYLLKDKAEILVGSEATEPGDGWPYDTILQGLNENLGWTTSQLGSWIVDKYYASYGNDQTQAVIDLSKVSALATAISEFTIAMRTSWNSEKTIVKNAANAVMTRIKDAVINSKVGENWRGAEGLSVYFPPQGYFTSSYNQTPFNINTRWAEFLNEYYNSMSGSWIESARNKAVYFYGDNSQDALYIDLYNFCSFLANPVDDSPGYTLQEIPYTFEDISSTGTRLNIADEAYARISSGFSFAFYDSEQSSISVSDNGVIYFEDYGINAYTNAPLPCSEWGQKFIAPYWDDFKDVVVYWQVKETENEKHLIIQWNEAVPWMENPNEAPNLNGGTFQVAIYQSGKIAFRYKDMNFGLDEHNNGNSATVGLQGSEYRGVQYSYNAGKISNGRALLLVPAGQSVCIYALSSTEKTFDYLGGDSTISVTTGNTCEWTSNSDVSWINITEGKKVTGSGQVRYTVSRNSELNVRKGTITIGEKKFVLIQTSQCIFSISPSEKYFNSTGGNDTFAVSTSNDGCSWEASSNVSWIAITSGVGTGNGNVVYSVAPNSSDKRVGNISIGNSSFVITQDAPDIPDVMSITNGVTVKGISKELGGRLYYKITVPSGTTNIQFFTNGESGNCDLYVKYGQMPTTEIYDSNSKNYSNDESIVVSNPSQGEWFVMLYAYQTFTGVSLTASYNSVVCNYDLSPSERSFSSSESTGSFDVNVDNACSWNPYADVLWIEILGTSSNMGNGKVDFKVLQNTNQNSRSGNILINGTAFTVTQEGAGNIEDVIELTNGVEQADISGDFASISYYKIKIPEGQNEFNIRLWGGEGDCDVYMAYNKIPAFDDYDEVSAESGNDSFLEISSPASGDWYVMLYGYSAYSGASIKAIYNSIVCEYSLSATEILAESSGLKGNITVNTDSTCQWEAASNDDWIVITSETKGVGTGAVSYSILANNDPNKRTGTLLIAGNLVFITQNGKLAVTQLKNGIVIDNQAGDYGEKLFFKIDVPPNQKNLSLDTWGGTGDIDMYARYGVLPTDYYDFKCFAWGNDENIYIKDPMPGEWYIMMVAYSDTSDFSIKAEYNASECNYTVYPMIENFDAAGGDRTLTVDVGEECLWTTIKHGTWIEILTDRRGQGNGSVTYSVPPNDSKDIRANNIRIADQWVTIMQAGTVHTDPEELKNNIAQTVSGGKDSEQYYQVLAPEGLKRLIIASSGGSGDCDLYVRYGAVPTFRTYDFRPYINGNDESIVVEKPQAGTWYIMLNGYFEYNNLSLVAQTVDKESVTILEAIGILQIISDMKSFSVFAMDLDFDKNKQVSIEDVIYVLQVVAGIQDHINSKTIMKIGDIKSALSRSSK